MLKLLASRLMTAVPSVVGVVFVTFMLTRLLPDQLGYPLVWRSIVINSVIIVRQIRHIRCPIDQSQVLWRWFEKSSV